jgi:hypothetical protein
MTSIVVHGGGKRRCIDGLVVLLLGGLLILVVEVLHVSLVFVHAWILDPPLKLL